MENGKRSSGLGLVFGIVFLDIVGFSILFPLFPSLLEHYLAREGADSLVGGLVRSLTDLAGGDEWAVVTLFGGVLGSVYSILQFLFTPLWGGLSDRIGRRPTLLFTLVGTVVAYVLWIFAGSFALLVVSRVLGGIMAGNISTATAVVADTTTQEKRAAGMGFVGMAIGLGFILGPALGGITAPGAEDLAASVDSAAFAWNPFSLAASVACGLAVLNLLLVAARLPETLPPEKRGTSAGGHVWNPLAQVRRLQLPGVTRTTVVYFLYLTAFSAMEFTLTFLAAERLGFTPRDNTWMFVFVGLTIALVQGGVVRRMAPRIGERKMAVQGFVLLLPGFLLIAFAHSTWMLYLGLFPMAVGSALAMPSLSALVSRYAPVDRQGLALGCFRSAGSLSRAVGPLLGGLLYWQLGAAAPYWVGAVFLLVPLALATRLPDPAAGPAAAA